MGEELRLILKTSSEARRVKPGGLESINLQLARKCLLMISDIAQRGRSRHARFDDCLDDRGIRPHARSERQRRARPLAGMLHRDHRRRKHCWRTRYRRVGQGRDVDQRDARPGARLHGVDLPETGDRLHKGEPEQYRKAAQDRTRRKASGFFCSSATKARPM